MDASGTVLGYIPHARYYEAELSAVECCFNHCCNCDCLYTQFRAATRCDCYHPRYLGNSPAIRGIWCGSSRPESRIVATVVPADKLERYDFQVFSSTVHSSSCCCFTGDIEMGDHKLPFINNPNTVTIAKQALCSNYLAILFDGCFKPSRLVPFEDDNVMEDNRLEYKAQGCLLSYWKSLDIMSIIENFLPSIASTVVTVAAVSFLYSLI